MPHGLPLIEVRAPVKAWWRSRTIWLNVGFALLALAEANFQLLQPLLPVNAYAALAFALPLINGVLRVITSTALSLSSPAEGSPS